MSLNQLIVENDQKYKSYDKLNDEIKASIDGIKALNIEITNKKEEGKKMKIKNLLLIPSDIAKITSDGDVVTSDGISLRNVKQVYNNHNHGGGPTPSPQL
mgnify:CR=1 FL=1